MREAVIRPARLEDAGALHRHCYPEASLDDLQHYLAWCLARERQGRILRLVAEVDGQAVANAQLTVWGGVGEIGSVVVAEDHRRQGLARKLITRLIGEARQRGLISAEIAVHEGQTAILAFYRRLGFEPVVEQKKGLSHSAHTTPMIQLRMGLCDRQSEKVLGGRLQSSAWNTGDCNDL